MAHARGLTELEGCVLGVIKARGPCTPYAVRREFQTSSTPYWSASAGAIYPLIVRLARRRLIAAVRLTGDARGGTLYAPTAAGVRALQRWLGPPLTPLVVGAPPDPIRSRVNFLGLLSKADRRRFLAEAATKLRQQLARTAALVKKGAADPFDGWALRGSHLIMKARLAWILEMARGLRVPLG